jgi:hypothetical protein
VEFRRAKYDIAAVRKILDAGLPAVLAGRLYEGVRGLGAITRDLRTGFRPIHPVFKKLF